MTDHYDYLTVVLEKDIRSDDAEALLQVIGQLRGVLKVEPNVVDGDSWTAMARARHEISEKVWEALWGPKPK